MDMTFIYGLVDPRDGRIRYVGKANDPVSRLRSHMKERSDCHRVHWLQQLIQADLCPGIVILEEVNVTGWQEAECRWVKHFREQGDYLVNGTGGGEGMGRPSEQTRRKMSNSHKGNQSALGHVVSKKERGRLSEIKKGNQFALGHIVSEEARRKMGEANKNNKYRLGRNHSEETRAKISASQKGRTRKGHPITTETKEKLSAVLKGKPWSAARRAAREQRS